MNETNIRGELNAVMRSGVRRVHTARSIGREGYPAADASFARDIHPMREILFVLSGECGYMFDGAVLPAVPGSAFFFNSWEPHGFGYRPEDHGLYHLWVHCTNRSTTVSVMRVDRGGQARIHGSSLKAAEDTAALLQRRWDEYAAGSDPGEEAARLFLATPLNLLLEDYLLQESGAAGRSGVDSRDITVFLRSYIESMNGRDCSLEKLEKICGYSRFHLAHLFSRRTGMSIGNYIDQVRRRFVLAAQQRGLKQKEIAAELGFSSPATFWTWQRRHMD